MADGPWWKRAKDRDKKVYAEWQELRTPEGLPYYYNTKTNVTTWDKPDALKSEEELANAGDWVWMPDQENCFVPARVVGQGGGQITLQTESGQQANVPSNTKLDPLKMASLVRVVADLTLLDNMHVPLILHNLRKRFEDRKIYTNIGTILVSVNPYQKLDLYTPEVIYEYQYRGVKDMPPHVFNVAHDAYRHMGEFGINNSVIISGESGAGKTEATKQCLAYLAAIAGSVSNVEQKILLANPILEAFGNAKTLRNDNSSRFGKYMEVFFNDKRQINGSLTTNYLLEKIRVVKQSQGERNFHVFYQLSKAASAQDRKQLCLGEPGDYNYTALSGCIDVDTIDDAHDFAALKDAFTALSFSAAEQKGVFTIISAILSLGNVEFKESGDRKANIPDKAWLDVAAGLLQVTPAALTKSMLIKELKIKGQANTQVSQSMKEASDNRDALGKFIYSEMFNWLVQKVNKAMGQTPKGCKSIGCLDIFGFEIFKENSFEQLCINYTNEMLQQHFNQHTFKLEEQLYKQEKIPFKHIEFIDNQPVLDLIEQKGIGILPLLDEELVMPKGSDATFLGKMHNAHAKTKNYQKVLKNPQQFVIVHYAGQVCYDTVGFLEKNRDTLTDDLLEMVCGSKLPLLNELFPKATLQMSTKDKKASLAKQFSRQLHDLMSTLNNTEPHYIRCVKPNPTKSACTFVPRMVFEQLTYSGVFEAVAIRKQGYPFRLTHKIFYDRYRCILKNPDQKFNNDKAGCEGIIKEMKLNMQNVQMGTTMCLYRSDEYKALELQYGIKVEKIRMNEQLKTLIARNPNEMKDAERDKFFEELSRAVMKADEFNLQSDVANKARKLLDDFIESRMDDDTRALLNAAKDEVNEEKLIEALAICDQNEYATKLVKECRRLLKRIQRINEEANKAIEILEELPMQVVLDAADEIKLSNQSVEYIREVLSCPKETLIKMQMGVATRMKDNARAIRITIRLKDLMFQKMQGSDMFDIKHYGKLKQAAEWNNEKFFSFLGAEARQEGMLKWTKDAIHSPLTDIKHPDPKVVKKLKGEVTTTFKMIQKYMGDRKDKDDVGTGREVVAMGLANPPLRDEIYMQTIKQLTDNPDAGSIRKGWMLMGLCLTTFPPGNDFENFLEVFLRKYAQPAPKYVGALHKIVFEGEMKRPPTLEEMIRVEETLTTRARGFSEPLPPAQPSYQDLLEKYNQMDKITNEYERKAPKAAEKAKKPAGPKKPEAKKAPAKKNPWIEAQDPSSGQTYYYNEETGESTWDRPPELDPIMSRISVVGQRW